MAQTRIKALGTCWILLGSYSLRGANTICSFLDPIGSCPDPTYLDGSLVPNDYFLGSPVLQYILLNKSTGGAKDNPSELEKKLGAHPGTFLEF